MSLGWVQWKSTEKTGGFWQTRQKWWNGLLPAKQVVLFVPCPHSQLPKGLRWNSVVSLQRGPWSHLTIPVINSSANDIILPAKTALRQTECQNHRPSTNKTSGTWTDWDRDPKYEGSFKKDESKNKKANQRMLLVIIGTLQFPSAISLQCNSKSSSSIVRRVGHLLEMSTIWVPYPHCSSESVWVIPHLWQRLMCQYPNHFTERSRSTLKTC